MMCGHGQDGPFLYLSFVNGMQGGCGCGRPAVLGLRFFFSDWGRLVSCGVVVEGRGLRIGVG